MSSITQKLKPQGLSALMTLGLALLGLSLAARPAYALKDDPSQPINVESQEQSADLQANKLVFSGEVVATQGSIKLNADKVEVTRNPNGSLQSIIAYGSPVTFEQQQDNGKYIRGRANTVSYLPEGSKVVLQGRATVWQGESRMTGERIEYNIATQRLRAANQSQGGRVSSTFVPADFKDNQD